MIKSLKQYLTAAFFDGVNKSTGKDEKYSRFKWNLFSGAWMRYGFHEDGILSTKKAIKKLLSDDSLNNNLINIL